ITWFFQQEPEGIILEDDTLPIPSFFRFCAELLDRYRHDERVMCISGTSFQDQTVDRVASYFFSRYTLFWGWASWRRAWSLYDSKMTHWPAYRDARMLRAWADGDEHFEKYWTHIFDCVCKDEIDTWDYQWRFSCWLHSGLTCQPKW